MCLSIYMNVPVDKVFLSRKGKIRYDLLQFSMRVTSSRIKRFSGCVSKTPLLAEEVHMDQYDFLFYQIFSFDSFNSLRIQRRQRFGEPQEVSVKYIRRGVKHRVGYFHANFLVAK